MNVLNHCSKLFLIFSILVFGISCQKEEDGEGDLPEPTDKITMLQNSDRTTLQSILSEDDNGETCPCSPGPCCDRVAHTMPQRKGCYMRLQKKLKKSSTSSEHRSTLPKPEFRVMNPNWNAEGQTCSNCLLELGVISEPNRTDFLRYEWNIHGATLQSTLGNGRYAFVKTKGPNTILYFAVRGVYQGGFSPWYSLNGITTSINDGNGPY